MSEIWNVIRWCISFILLTNSAFFLWVTITCMRDMNVHPEEYQSNYGRLSCKQILTIFAVAGIACLILMFIAIPL